jgi:D-serine dehydratase
MSHPKWSNAGDALSPLLWNMPLKSPGKPGGTEIGWKTIVTYADDVHLFNIETIKEKHENFN